MAGIAEQLIRPAAARQVVVAAAPMQDVIAGAAKQDSNARIAGERVVGAGAADSLQIDQGVAAGARGGAEVEINRDAA